MNRMAKAGGALCAEGAKAHPPLDNISMNAPTDLIRESYKNAVPKSQRWNIFSLRKLPVLP